MSSGNSLKPWRWPSRVRSLAETSPPHLAEDPLLHRIASPCRPTTTSARSASTSGMNSSRSRPLQPRSAPPAARAQLSDRSVREPESCSKGPGSIRRTTAATPIRRPQLPIRHRAALRPSRSPLASPTAADRRPNRSSRDSDATHGRLNSSEICDWSIPRRRFRSLRQPLRLPRMRAPAIRRHTRPAGRDHRSD